MTKIINWFYFYEGKNATEKADVDRNKFAQAVFAKHNDIAIHCAKDRNEYYISNPNRRWEFWKNIIYKQKVIK
jgi:hypothetical protein